MNNLTLGDLLLGLADLLNNRRQDLERSAVGRVYMHPLRGKLGELESLPDALTGKLPLALQLANADSAHDGYGAAIYYLIEGHLRHPGTDENRRALLLHLREAFIPALGELKQSYPEEAFNARSRKQAFGKLAAELQSIPVMDGHTLQDWVRAFIAQGESLDKLLSERALATAQEAGTGRAAAGALRSNTIGLLGRLRAAMADELSDNPELPRNLDALVFGYFDELSRLRAAAIKAAPPEPPPAPPAGPL